MLRTIFLSLLIQVSAFGLISAGLDPVIAEKIRLLSAETFFDAISYELKKSPAAKEALKDLEPQALAAALAEKAAGGEKLTQAGLFREVAALVRLGGLDKKTRASAERAIEEARAYLAPEELPAWDEPARPGPAKAPAGLVTYNNGSPEASGTDPALLDWKDKAGYTSSRIGPLCAVLETLRPADKIVLSNLGLAAMLPELGAQKEIISLHLPISGYAKKLWLLAGEDGDKTLLISDFQGRTFLRHFELLLKSYYSGKEAPLLSVAEARKAYEPYYKALARLQEEKGSELGELEGLIAGYAETFRIYWSSYAVASVSDSAGDWRLDIYRPAGTGRWGVISARSSFYGETLGENIRYLVEKSTGIKTVIIAGSGGSLETRPLYDIVYPSHVITPGGKIVPNVLGSQADFRAHKSALSPLEETPPWLSDALEQGIGTVDVEMGPAAGILEGRGLRLGFAVLATDFPIRRPALEKAMKLASLARQDSGAKYRGLSAYAKGIENWISRGVPPGWQPIEKKIGRPLAEQSALNLSADEKSLAPFSEEEKGLLAKLEKYFRDHPPSFSVRMSRFRAARILDDRAFLSTELVADLKGSEVAPFTPSYEQRSFGAYRYIFGTLSYWDGPEKYGDTVLRIKTKTWKRRAWATRRSGFRALVIAAGNSGVDQDKIAADPVLTKKGEAIFASWIVTPEDMPGSVALQIIGELRRRPPETTQDFLKAGEKDIPGLIARHDVGWLEGKIADSVQVEDIDLIKTPSPAEGNIAASAAKLGINVLSAP
ncbi:MAG: hypothetical protein COX65_05365 [Elusimicrobia bacterium CG_4_10_14_0_2_um_filter_56_8]|nr:MAG: hypothetical protein COX65_05365 [Elusimicrobia bacterium CG_4_10_14_0_2_um_filter_56_8]